MKPITIVGGGLAGLTLGILLRREGVPVTLWEAGHYPRHRVCGEFLSGQGKEILKSVGVYDKVMSAGAQEAKTARFFFNQRAGRVMNLPETAICCSRKRMDALLAQEFADAGGELKTGSRYTEKYGEGIIRATGRQMEPEVGGWRWLGLKGHAANVKLSADLEMHLIPGGYVGLCQIEDGSVNVCGLFRTRTQQKDLRKEWKSWLCGPAESRLSITLSQAQFRDETFCSVAGLPLRKYAKKKPEALSIGDAVTMIPPLTGNGMSLAMESAKDAAPAVRAYADGGIKWSEIQWLVPQEYGVRYGARLNWAGWLQGALFLPGVSQVLAMAGMHIPSLFLSCFHRTRN